MYPVAGRRRLEIGGEVLPPVAGTIGAAVCLGRVVSVKLRRAAVGLVGALGLAACAPAPVRPPPPAAPPPVAEKAAAVVEAAPVAAPAPVAPAVPLPPWIARFENPGCAWSTESWSYREVTWLRMRPGGAALARVARGRVQVQIPAGPGDHAMMEVGASGLVLSGFVERSAITLYAAREFALSGVVMPSSSTPLGWKEGFAGGVAVTMAAPPEIIVAKPPLLARRPCGEVTLDRGANLDLARAAFGKSYGSGKALRGNRVIEVFSDPARAAEIRLVVGAEKFVSVYSEQGAFSRIGVFLGGNLVAGWVRSANLMEVNGGWGGSPGGYGLIGAGSGYRRPLMRLTCAADVPVIAEAGGERATVGFILAGTMFDVLAEKGEFSQVWVKNRSIHPADAALAARMADLAGCKRSEV